MDFPCAFQPAERNKDCPYLKLQTTKKPLRLLQMFFFYIHKLLFFCCFFLFIHKWVFPKIGIPPNHPFNRVFPYKPSILGGFPPFWNHPNVHFKKLFQAFFQDHEGTALFQSPPRKALQLLRALAKSEPMLLSTQQVEMAGSGRIFQKRRWLFLGGKRKVTPFFKIYSSFLVSRLDFRSVFSLNGLEGDWQFLLFFRNVCVKLEKVGMD